VRQHSGFEGKVCGMDEHVRVCMQSPRPRGKRKGSLEGLTVHLND